MRDEHKHLMVCGRFEGFDIVPDDMVIAVKLKRKKSKNINNSVRKPVVQELNAQQKNLSILHEDKHGAAAFSVYGLQDARFVTAASSQGLTVSKNAIAVAVISPKMEHDMVYMLVTRVRAPSQLVFLGLELNSFLTRKPQPHLALYLQRFNQNELYFFSDLKTSLKNYSFGVGLGLIEAEKFFGIAEKRREDVLRKAGKGTTGLAKKDGVAKRCKSPKTHF